MKGESVKLDPFNVQFLNQCLSDLAHKVNSNDNTEMVDFVKSLDNLQMLSKAAAVKSYSKKKEVSITD